MNNTPSLALFGATGSIGTSTLEVLKANPNRYRLAAISGHNNISRLAELTNQWQPQWVVVTNKANYSKFIDLLVSRYPEVAGKIQVLAGAEPLDTIATDSSISTIVAAVSGTAGLSSSYKALAYGKMLLVANKEPLVAAGELIIEAASKGGGSIVPIDSEHSGAWQCLGCPSLPLSQPPDVVRMILTASGGPLLDWNAENIANVTAEQACCHPNWSMGKKISVDSATMMNKGLELIEASRLFDIAPNKLEVVIHRQSIIHAMVEYNDGSILAQLSRTNMKVPLAKALGFPDLLSSDTAPLDIATLGKLEFEQPDMKKFPCLSLAIDALRAGGDMPLRLNAANEIAVDHFLKGDIGFGQIAELVERMMHRQASANLIDLQSVIDLDNQVRKSTRQLIRESFL